jgi:hypothetical protein
MNKEVWLSGLRNKEMKSHKSEKKGVESTISRKYVEYVSLLAFLSLLFLYM